MLTDVDQIWLKCNLVTAAQQRALWYLSFMQLLYLVKADTHVHFMALCTLSRITQVSWFQKGKTNLDFTDARDSEWQ